MVSKKVDPPEEKSNNKSFLHILAHVLVPMGVPFSRRPTQMASVSLLDSRYNPTQTGVPTQLKGQSHIPTQKRHPALPAFQPETPQPEPSQASDQKSWPCRNKDRFSQPSKEAEHVSVHGQHMTFKLRNQQKKGAKTKFYLDETSIVEETIFLRP